MNSEPLRIIQVGIGGWGSTWLDRATASDSWRLVAIVDIDRTAAENAADRAGVPRTRVFASIEAAAGAVGADAALVVVPAAVHHRVCLAALDAGLHVLVEKPLADTLAHARDVVAAAEATGRTLMVSQNFRYRRSSRVVERILGEGWLGPVEHARIVFRKEMHFSQPPVPHGFGLYDFVRDGAIHTFDQIRGLLHCEPVTAFGRTYNPSWSWFEHPPLLSAIIEIEGGGIVEYSGSWTARGTETSFDGDWYIECAKGQIDFRSNRVRVRPQETWLTIQMDGFLEREGWLEAEIPTTVLEDRTFALEEFADCIRAGREPETSGRDNLRTLALAFAIQDSAAEGQPRSIADYLA